MGFGDRRQEAGEALRKTQAAGPSSDQNSLCTKPRRGQSSLIRINLKHSFKGFIFEARGIPEFGVRSSEEARVFTWATRLSEPSLHGSREKGEETRWTHPLAGYQVQVRRKKGSF